MDYGKCIPAKAAYEEAISGKSAPGTVMRKKGESPRLNMPGRNIPGITPPAEHSAAAYDNYRSGLYKSLGGMIEDPVTPLVKNPKVVRTLILPYPGKGTAAPLYMPRFVYFFADEPTWVFGQNSGDQPRESTIIPLPEKNNYVTE